MEANQDYIKNCDPVEQNFILKLDNFDAFSHQRLETLIKRKKLIDFHIFVDGKYIPAHKVILASTIPYFHNVFAQKFKKSALEVFEIKEQIDYTSMEKLIDFCYFGQLDINASNVESLLLGASFLQMQKVSDACCEYIKKNLHFSNVFKVQVFADQHGYEDLADSADFFIRKNFQDVIKMQGYRDLTLKQVCKIISNDDLNVTKEEKVFEAVLLWVKHHTKRRRHLSSLLKLVRFPLINSEYLVDSVSTEKLIKSSLACRNLIEEAQLYHFMPNRRGSFKSFQATPRKCPLNFLLCIFFRKMSENLENLIVQFFYPETKSAKDVYNLSQNYVDFAIRKNLLYLISLSEENKGSNAIDLWDEVKAQGTKIASPSSEMK